MRIEVIVNFSGRPHSHSWRELRLRPQKSTGSWLLLAGRVLFDLGRRPSAAECFTRSSPREWACNHSSLMLYN
ncbi:hypothetical protein NDU88_004246 [Pleurodeles waltl]|uniref:Uncharacterized protein n=1 Tax=Pleurodeles waltl TaxID=8319 RepID=A0AAV7SIA3_PLEWA|nr:hypothetical protein NDU88_004246 [Pleurodeles waltl]